MDKKALLRRLPSVEEVLSQGSLGPLLLAHGRGRVAAAVRIAVAQLRERLLSGEPLGARGQRGDRIPIDAERVQAILEQEERLGLRRVINATGVILHTNLGRAPLPRTALEAIARTCGRYASLELSLATGERASRGAKVEALLAQLTGAEAALVVNNNAAAVLLVLTALARGKEVIVSRGEAVEIGGGFRIHEIMRQSGAVLVEVGTANQTRLSDYEAAIGEQTALLLKVHKSNFRVVGFTGEVSAAELAALGRRRGLPVFEDLGSGCLIDLREKGLPEEPTAAAAVASGATLVSFSGDKLLGGPQAGLLVGEASHVRRLERHPLMRAVRVDKLTLAALEAVLELYARGKASELPALALLFTPAEAVRARAERLQAALTSAGVAAQVVSSTGEVGGGALPTAELPSFSVRLSSAEGPEALARKLRVGATPVIGRIHEGALLLDLRAVFDDEVEELARAVAGALKG